MLISLVYVAHLTNSDRQYQRTQRTNVSKYARSVSNGFLSALEACLVNLELPLKTIDLFRYLRGTLVVTKMATKCGFFVSSESVSYPYGSGRKSELMK